MDKAKVNKWILEQSGEILEAYIAALDHAELISEGLKDGWLKLKSQDEIDDIVKEMQYQMKNKDTIIVDTRESRSKVPRLLKSLDKVVFKTLAYGDYQIGEFLFERKSIQDFVSSIYDGRLFKQARDMKDLPFKCAIILEGRVTKYVKVDPNVLAGAKLSVSMDFGIPIIPSDNATETARLLHTTMKRIQKEPTTYRVNNRKKPKSKEELKLFILESFKGIGAKKALLLNESRSTLMEIFNDIDDLEEIHGITKKDIRTIKEILN